MNTIRRLRRWVLFCAVALLLGSLQGLSAAPGVPKKQGRQHPPPQSLSRANLQAAWPRLAAAKERMRLPNKGVNPGCDTLRVAALRVEFPNLAMGESPPPELHDRFYFETQFFYVTQYFDAASNGRAKVLVDVPDFVASAAHNQEYYGDFAYYDSLMVELTGELVQQFDPVLDFSLYDAYILLHAGPGQESDLLGDSPRQIWSGFLDEMEFREQLSTEDEVVLGFETNDGVLVDEIIVLPEWEVQDLQPPDFARLGSLGVYVHEIGQRLGMLPLFDPDPTPRPNSQGIGNFGVMSYGLWVGNGFIPALPSAFNRLLMGWVDPLPVEGDTNIDIPHFEWPRPDSTVVYVPISAREYWLVSYILEDPEVINTCVAGRFFKFEDKNGNCRFDFEDTNDDSILSPGDLIDTFLGAEWNFFMSDLVNPPTSGEGYGLLIQHVDELAILESLAEDGVNPNRNPERKGVDIEEADGIQDLDLRATVPRSFGSKEDYFVPGLVFGPDTTPSTHSVNGAPTGVSIELLEFPQQTELSPGRRARLRIRRSAGAVAGLSPLRSQRQQSSGGLSGDLTSMTLAGGSRGLVVLGDAGRVFLLDGSLNEAPIADGNPDSLSAWATIPTAFQGVFVGSPLVGELDTGTSQHLAVIAEADSADTTVTRVFVWNDDGTDWRDNDLDPLTHSGYLATMPGELISSMFFDIHEGPGQEIVVSVSGSTQSGIHVFPPDPSCNPPSTGSGALYETVEGNLIVAGPVGIHGPLDNSCLGDRALVWIEQELQSGECTLYVDHPFQCCGEAATATLSLGVVALAGEMRLAAADLDADQLEEVVVVAPNGLFWVVRNPTLATGISIRTQDQLDDTQFSPLAFDDLDGNGTLEVVLSGRTQMHALSFSGAEMPGWPYVYDQDPLVGIEPQPAQGAGSPLIADFDGDDEPEILQMLPRGAALVWDRMGSRLPDLEGALPAMQSGSGLLADLDEDSLFELYSVGSFEDLIDYDADAAEALRQTTGEIVRWDFPLLSEVGWAELGGSPGRSFRVEAAGPVDTRSNDPTLKSFSLGPNPAREELRARIELTQAAVVTCTLYNLEGEIVLRERRSGQAGEIVELRLDLGGVASGVYLARMQLSTGGARVGAVAVQR